MVSKQVFFLPHCPFKIKFVMIIQKSTLHKALVWLEYNVRVPLQGSYFDIYIALPAKNAYTAYTQLDKAH